jgi:hypothetical protein
VGSSRGAGRVVRGPLMSDGFCGGGEACFIAVEAEEA